MLHDKGLLLRHYTQNIDGLEFVAALPPEKIVGKSRNLSFLKSALTSYVIVNRSFLDCWVSSACPGSAKALNYPDFGRFNWVDLSVKSNR